ncbi:MAG: Hsp70 family protein [Planctomycetes bacterium]|nr:Hsp70 family protein [Planctomycetota bacterium]
MRQSRSRAVGIDLGTINLVVAVLPAAGGTPVLFLHPTGMATTPSCLWKRQDDRLRPGQTRFVVGGLAVSRQGTRPEPIRSIKSRMTLPLRVAMTEEGVAAQAARIQADMGRPAAQEALGEPKAQKLAREVAEARFGAVRDAIGMRTGERPEKLTPADLLAHADVLAELGFVLVTDELMTPAEVSAYYLLETRRQIEQTVAKFATDDEEWTVDRAVVTVPAYFEVTARNATRRAAELAGFEQVDLLDEPTAAAYYHCSRTKTQNGTFLVYDFGGGTFDVSVLQVKDGHSSLLGLSGNTRLGGDQIDEAIAEHLRQKLCEQGWSLQLDLTDADDRLCWQQLKVMAERVKKEMSTSTSCTLRSDDLTDHNGDRVIVEMTFTRPARPDWESLSPIEELVRAVTARTIPYCDEALADAARRAGITLADVDAVILIGGTTHSPLVREMVRNELCVDPDPAYVRAQQQRDPASAAMFAARKARVRNPEPVYQDADTAVALGAALMAAAAGDVLIPAGVKDYRLRVAGAGLTDRTDTVDGQKVALIHVGMVVEKRGADGTGAWQPVPGAEVAVASPRHQDDGQTDARGRVTVKDLEFDAGMPARVAITVNDRSNGREVKSHLVVREGEGLEELPPPRLLRTLRLEVEMGGRRVLDTLVAKFASLPANESHRFHHPGTEIVELPLYLNRTKIRVIEVRVPPMPRGTPIVLNVHVDKSDLITVDGKIGDEPFEAAVVPPPPRGAPTPEEVKTLDARFDLALSSLAPAGQMAPRVRWEQTRPVLDQALQSGNAESAVVQFEELEEILGDAEVIEVPLRPSLSDFEKRIDDALAINREAAEKAQESRKPYDAAENERTVRALQEEGRRAYQRKDQKFWSDIQERLDALIKHMVKSCPPPTAAQIAAYFLGQVQQAVPDLMTAAAEQRRTEFRGELAQMQAAVRPLVQKIPDDADGVAAKARAMYERVQEIAKALGKGLVEPPGVVQKSMEAGA